MSIAALFTAFNVIAGLLACWVMALVARNELLRGERFSAVCSTLLAAFFAAAAVLSAFVAVAAVLSIPELRPF